MKPAPFIYFRPNTMDEAVRLLADAGGSARPLAGGQSLVAMLNLRLAPVERLIDIAALSDLRSSQDAGGAFLYGALTTHAAFEDGTVPDITNGLMRHVAARIAFRAVRNRGTIGGAIALADPAADWLTTIVALEAKLHLVGPGGRRAVPADEFVLGPYLTALDEAELLAAVEIRKRPSSERWGYFKVATKIGEYAESMSLVVLDRGAKAARVVLGAADGAPIVLSQTAARLLQGAAPESLGNVVRQELIDAERDFTPAKLLMHTTTTLRAIRDAVTK